MFDAAFPHHCVTVEAIVSQGDLVSVLHTHTATHAGVFMGMPLTDKSVVVNGLELFRIYDGKITEFWRKDDDVSLLMQLGMLRLLKQFQFSVTTDKAASAPGAKAICKTWRHRFPSSSASTKTTLPAFPTFDCSICLMRETRIVILP